MPARTSSASTADPLSRIKAHISLTWTPAARHALTEALAQGLATVDNDLLPMPAGNQPGKTGERSLIGRRVRQVVTRCLREVAWPASPFMTATAAARCEIGVTFVDDAQMQELNSQYRGKNKPTDVLSFAQNEGDAFPAGFATDDAPFALGDLIISIETAQRQAGEQRHDLLTEITFLAIHGTLHLMGYDHQTAAQRRLMWKWQDALFEDYKAEAAGRDAKQNFSGKDEAGN